MLSYSSIVDEGGTFFLTKKLRMSGLLICRQACECHCSHDLPARARSRVIGLAQDFDKKMNV